MSINFKKIIHANNINEVKQKVVDLLQTEGFGILTEINFSQKLQEKIGVTIPESLILGACNPKLAYEVYQIETDFLSLVPCNVVIRALDTNHTYSIEMIKPTSMIEVLHNPQIDKLAHDMDQVMQKLLDTLN